MTYTMTLRLDDQMGLDLELIAAVDRQKMAETVRLAIEAHITLRRRDLSFQDSLLEYIGRIERMLPGSGDNASAEEARRAEQDAEAARHAEELHHLKTSEEAAAEEAKRREQEATDDEAFLFEKTQTSTEQDTSRTKPLSPQLHPEEAEEAAQEVMEGLLDNKRPRTAEERLAEALQGPESEAWDATIEQVRTGAAGGQEIILKNPLGRFDRFPGDEPELPFTAEATS